MRKFIKKIKKINIIVLKENKNNEKNTIWFLSDTLDLIRYGLKVSLVLNHKFVSRFAYSLASFPFEPNIFVVLMSAINLLSKKYLVKAKVLLRHCKALFIKQVFPKLWRPVIPNLDFSLTCISSSSSSSESSAASQYRLWYLLSLNLHSFVQYPIYQNIKNNTFLLIINLFTCAPQNIICEF